MGRSAIGTLSDRDIVDYLSKRVYVECTDSGDEDPNRFDSHMYPGNFRHQISMHITRIQAGQAYTPQPLRVGERMVKLEDIQAKPIPDEQRSDLEDDRA
jgi:hypothetical protein